VNQPVTTTTADPVRALVQQVTAHLPRPSPTTNTRRGKSSKSDTSRTDSSDTDNGDTASEYRAILTVLSVLRQLGPDRVIAGLWPGSLMVHGAIVRDISYRYRILDHPKAQIARDIRQPEYLISYVLARTGAPRQRPGKRHLWTTEQIAELKRRRRMDEPVEVIAAAVGVSEYWVTLKLIDLGLAHPLDVRVRPRNPDTLATERAGNTTSPSPDKDTPT
jgi:hypothetical protein